MKKKFIYGFIALIIPVLLCGCDSIQQDNNGPFKNKNKTSANTPEIKRQLPPPPQIKDNYNSVAEYYSDMIKVQNSIHSYKFHISKKMIGPFATTVFKNDFYKKYDKLLKVNTGIESSMGGEEPFLSKKILYDGQHVIAYDLDENYLNENNIKTQGSSENMGVYLSPKDTPVSYKEVMTDSIYLDYIPQIWDWLKIPFSEQYYTNAKFGFKDAVYNGETCRLITLDESIKNGQTNSGMAYSNKNKKEVCVSDKYGIAIYYKTEVRNTMNPNDFYIEEINVTGLEANNVKDSVFNPPAKIIK